MYNSTIQYLTLIMAPVLQIYDYHRLLQRILRVNTYTQLGAQRSHGLQESGILLMFLFFNQQELHDFWSAKNLHLKMW
jgi:hypothetical protein